MTLLLAEVEKPLSDETLERALDSLIGYDSPKVREAMAAHLNHKNPRVSSRARVGMDHFEYREKHEAGGRK